VYHLVGLKLETLGQSAAGNKVQQQDNEEQDELDEESEEDDAGEEEGRTEQEEHTCPSDEDDESSWVTDGAVIFECCSVSGPFTSTGQTQTAPALTAAAGEEGGGAGRGGKGAAARVSSVGTEISSWYNAEKLIRGCSVIVGLHPDQV
jgi:hypothetical protein